MYTVIPTEQFELDEENGKFKETGRKIETESPVCVVFK